MSYFKTWNAVPLLLLGVLLTLTGCASTPSAEPPLIVQCPNPGALTAALSRIGLQPSTEVLQKASAWSLNSKELLNAAMPKSQP